MPLRYLDLQAVLDHLVERARPWPLDEAVATTATVRPPGEDLDLHQLLAVLMLRQPMGLLEALDTVAPDLIPAERHQLAGFLLTVATIYRPLRAYEVERDAAPPAAAGLSIGGGVTAALRPDLLALAELVSITQPAGALEVVAAPLEGAWGRYERRLDGGRILLDLEAPDVDKVFAHELGHALDPAPDLLVALEERERFADDLGALLLNRPPTALAGVYALVAEVLEERAPATVGVDAVLADVVALAWYVAHELAPAPALVS